MNKNNKNMIMKLLFKRNNKQNRINNLSNNKQNRIKNKNNSKQNRFKVKSIYNYNNIYKKIHCITTYQKKKCHILKNFLTVFLNSMSKLN